MRREPPIGSVEDEVHDPAGHDRRENPGQHPPHSADIVVHRPSVIRRIPASGWAAVETGEGEEEQVEQVVAESALHGHEEAAERFLLLSGAVLALAAAGMLRGMAGGVARVGATAGALALVALGAQVGHSGGTLVYRDGAASAYTAGPAGTGVADTERAERDD